MKVGTASLSTTTYDPQTGLLQAITYGNGGSVSYTYDDFGRVTETKFNVFNDDGLTYGYDAQGSVAYVKDSYIEEDIPHEAITSTNYDLAGHPCRKTTLRDGIHEYTGELAYNDYELPNSFKEYVGEDREKHTTTFTYDAENRPTAIHDDGGAAGQNTTTYDGFGRMSGYTVKAGGTGSPYNTIYTCVQGVSSDKTTPLIESISQSGANFSYTYDNVGNITSVTQDDGTACYTTSYVYDAIGQLIRVNAPLDLKGGINGTTWLYSYDPGGNILSKRAYAYTTGTVGTILESHSYTYNNDNWRDKLMAYDDYAITYDAIGNPTYDGTWHYEWQHGRQLKRMGAINI